MYKEIGTTKISVISKTEQCPSGPSNCSDILLALIFGKVEKHWSTQTIILWWYFILREYLLSTISLDTYTSITTSWTPSLHNPDRVFLFFFFLSFPSSIAARVIEFVKTSFCQSLKFLAAFPLIQKSLTQTSKKSKICALVSPPALKRWPNLTGSGTRCSTISMTKDFCLCRFPKTYLMHTERREERRRTLSPKIHPGTWCRTKRGNTYNLTRVYVSARAYQLVACYTTRLVK